MTAEALLLLTWLSPAFPTGAYAYSHGLEQAVEAGDVRCEDTAGDWIEDLVRDGAGRSDAILLRHAWRARSPGALAEVAELAAAAQPSAERRLETLAQGEAFSRAADVWNPPLTPTLSPRERGQQERFLLPLPRGYGIHTSLLVPERSDNTRCHCEPPAWAAKQPRGKRRRSPLGCFVASAPRSDRFGSVPASDAKCESRSPRGEGRGEGRAAVAYPVALGARAAAHGVAEDAAALGLLHGFCANLVSACVRLVPLGQTAGLRVQARLAPVLLSVADETKDASLDEIGGACFRADVASMRHETQATRLFRS